MAAQTCLYSIPSYISSQTSQRLQWLALSLTYEIVDAIKGLDVNLEAQVDSDTNVLSSLSTIGLITRDIMKSQDNWLTLQGCFSLIRKLASITEMPNPLNPTQPPDINPEKITFAKTLSDFQDVRHTHPDTLTHSNTHPHLPSKTYTHTLTHTHTRTSLQFFPQNRHIGKVRLKVWLLMLDRVCQNWREAY